LILIVFLILISSFYYSKKNIFNINATTGEINFTPEDADEGNYSINISVTDNAAFPRTDYENPKIVIITLDGATWNVIEPMVKKGELPNFAKLMNEGAYGGFLCQPPVSPQSWTSIATGVYEDKHGINDFYITLPENTEMIATNRLIIKTKTLWEIVDENNKRVGLLNWLITWPPQKFKEGFVIPNNWLTKDNSTYPPNLREEIENNVDIKRFEGNSSFSWDEPSDDYFESEMIETDNLIKTVPYLLKKYNPYLFSVGFYFTNQGQHLFWKYMEPQLHCFNVTKEEIEKFDDVIPFFYRKIDNFIEKFVQDEDVTLFVLSDHGMGRLDPDEIACLDYGTFIREYDDLLNLMGLLYYKNNSKDIDWIRTKAYYCGGILEKGFCINLKGRNPKGIVEYEEFETLKTEIKNKLQNIIFLDENESLDVWHRINNRCQEEELGIFPTAKIFSNVNKDDYPDVTFNIHYCVEYKDTKNLLKKKILIDNKIYELGDFIKWGGISADHEEEGILFMKGPNLKKDVLIENAKNIDITPTILYLMGLPVGENMDGRVLTEAINEEYLKRNRIEYKEYTKENITTEVISSEQVNIEKLKALGYLS